MLHLHRRILNCLVALTVATTVACSRDAGPTGPAGPTGQAGPAGPAGPAGSANVIYSKWTTITGPGADSTVDNSKLRVVHLSAPELTQSIMDSGAIMVYLRFGDVVSALPYTNFAGNKVNTIDFIPKVGDIVVTRFTHDNSGSVAFGALQYRYVLIPGGVAAGVAANLLDYRQMRLQFGIPD